MAEEMRCPGRLTGLILNLSDPESLKFILEKKFDMKTRVEQLCEGDEEINKEDVENVVKIIRSYGTLPKFMQNFGDHLRACRTCKPVYYKNRVALVEVRQATAVSYGGMDDATLRAMGSMDAARGFYELLREADDFNALGLKEEPSEV